MRRKQKAVILDITALFLPLFLPILYLNDITFRIPGIYHR